MLRKIGIDFRLRRTGKLQWGRPVFNLRRLVQARVTAKAPAGTLDSSNVLIANRKSHRGVSFANVPYRPGELFFLALLGLIGRWVGDQRRAAQGLCLPQNETPSRAAVLRFKLPPNSARSSLESSVTLQFASGWNV